MAYSLYLGSKAFVMGQHRIRKNFLSIMDSAKIKIGIHIKKFIGEYSMKIHSVIIFLFCLLCANFTFAENRKVILLETMPVPVVISHSQAIVQSFETYGYTNRENLDLEILRADGSKERAVNLLKKTIADKKPDLVITLATLASQAAVEVLAGTNIPILFCVVADPIGSKVVKSLEGASGSNISGVVFTQQRETKVEIVMRLLANSAEGRKVKIGIISTDYPSGIGDIRELEKVAALSDEIEFVTHIIPYEGVPGGVSAMKKNVLVGLESLKGKVDYLWQNSGPLGEMHWFTLTLLDSGIPVVHGHTVKSVESGALMTVLYDTQSAAGEIVRMADKIFQGTDVGTLPITVPENFNFYLNMHTAEELGLTVPSHLLMIAGDNIIR